jgi:AraC-like DNA-binding protein
MGLAPYEYILAARIEECRKLLSAGISIAEAAARTGFCDQSHLNRHFKRIVGITPGKYVAGAAAAPFKRDPARP